MSEVWFHLMRDVRGCQRFIVCGDTGRGVACDMAVNHPEAVCGLHPTDAGLMRDLIFHPEQGVNAEELDCKHRAVERLRLEGAYESIQTAKPQTLRFALADSPAALAAWLCEKYHTWSDWERFRSGHVLAALTLSRTTNSGAASVRMYHGSSFDLPPLPLQDLKMPVGITAFPKDVLPTPRAWIERTYPVIRCDIMGYGGHFTALENPAGFAESLRGFIADLGQV